MPDEDEVSTAVAEPTTTTDDAPADIQPAPDATSEGADDIPEQHDPLADGWQVHPDVVSHLETSVETAKREQQSSIDAATDRKTKVRELAFEEEKATLIRQTLSSEGVRQVMAVSTAFLDKLEADGLGPQESAKEFQKVLSANPEWAQVFNQGQQTSWTSQGQRQGFLAATELAGKDLSASHEGDMSDLVTDLRLDLAKGKIDASSAFEQMLKKRDELVKAEGVAEGEKAVKARHEAEARNAEQTGKGTPVSVSGRGSQAAARGDMAKLMDPSTPVSELIEIRERQKAAQ